MKKRIVLVANDKSPSDAFAKLGDVCESRGHEVVRFLGHGNLEATEAEIASAITEKVEKSLVIIGMSSKPSLAEAEIFASKVATDLGACFGYFSDSFGCYRREWFAPFRKRAEFLFIASKAEEGDAHDHFLFAHIGITGNPSWEGFENPDLMKEDIRQAIGAKGLERVVLVPLNKVRDASVDLAVRCIVAHANQDETIGSLVVVAPHPGAVKQNPKEADELRAAIDAKLVDAYGRLPRFTILREKAMGVKSQDIIPVARFVFSANSPTTDLQAALLRIPVFNYLEHPETKTRILNETGGRTPPLCDLGAALAVTDPAKEIFREENYQKIISGQVRAFPWGPMPVGTAVDRMIKMLTV